MITSFDDAFAALMQNEGGYVNNPVDPGGATMYGITERVARAHGYAGDMHDIPLDLAKSIAKAEYWNPYQCDQMPPLIAFQVMDAAYNGGRPAQWLQQAVGVSADGVIGAQTIKAVRTMDQDLIIRRFDGYRLRYLASLKMWPEFSRGWANRISGNLLRE